MAIKFPELSYKNIPVNITTNEYLVYGSSYNDPMGSHRSFFKKPYNTVSFYIENIYMDNDVLTNYIIRNNIFCMHFDQEWSIVKFLTSSNLFDGIEDSIAPADPKLKQTLYAFCTDDKQVVDIKLRL